LPATKESQPFPVHTTTQQPRVSSASERRVGVFPLNPHPNQASGGTWQNKCSVAGLLPGALRPNQMLIPSSPSSWGVLFASHLPLH
jgi:hypothetical protein